MGKFGTLKRFLLGQPPKVKEVFLTDYLDPKDNLDFYFGRQKPPVPPRPIISKVSEEQQETSFPDQTLTNTFPIGQESALNQPVEDAGVPPSITSLDPNTKETPEVEEWDHASDSTKVGCEAQSQPTQQRNGMVPVKPSGTHYSNASVSQHLSGHLEKRCSFTAF
jgi:hypothetical protein